MNVRFHVYARSHGREVPMGALDSSSVACASRIWSRSIGVKPATLESLALSAIRTPMVKHHAHGVTVWAVPTVA